MRRYALPALGGVLLALLALLACGRQRAKPAPAVQDADSVDAALEVLAAVPAPDSSVDDAVAPKAPCPAEMALIDQRFCIDKWEASLVDESGAEHSPFHAPGVAKVRAVSRPDVVPQGYIAMEEAQRACSRAGKKVCTTQQWVDACMGSRAPKRTFPYGNKRAPGACNDSYRGHPVDKLLPGRGRPRDVLTLNDPRINQLPSTLAKTGSHPECATPEGVYDLVGNLLEWTTGSRPLLMGGHYADSSVNGAGCTYVTMDHDAQYHDYTTGFRCCLAASLPVESAAPPPVAEPGSACPGDMVLVEGIRCGLVEQECLRWVDPPGGIPGRACGEFAQPTRCQGARHPMRFCIDRYEYTSQGQALPLVQISFAEAENLCHKQGKRMCEEREWEFACEGPEGLPFPYGYVRDGAKCNHDLDDLFQGGKLRDRRVAADSLPGCKSPFGVFNLVGNVDEWVLRQGKQSPWRSVLKGGWWLTGRNRCRAVTDSHDESYAGPQTGFRCCKAARRKD